MNYLLAKAIEEGKEKRRQDKLKRLSENKDRQRMKKQCLDDNNSIKKLRERAKEMKEKIVPSTT